MNVIRVLSRMMMLTNAAYPPVLIMPRNAVPVGSLRWKNSQTRAIERPATPSQGISGASFR